MPHEEEVLAVTAPPGNDSPGPSDRGDRPGVACLIGAGAAGLVAGKALAERDIPFRGYEMGSDVGGLWRYGNDSGRSVAYGSLRSNTSRHTTGYRCFPMPDELPDYPHHGQILRYFEDFADEFGLRERFAFRRRVMGVARAGEEDGAWDVTVRDLETGAEETRRHGAVLVASGHHSDPARPEFPGRLDGPELHSSEYRAPDILEGRRVLVVGIGNSACDIAVEAAGVAERVLLSTRRGAYVLPKYVLGRPLDHWASPLVSRLPPDGQMAVFRLLLRLGGVDTVPEGFPEPDHPFGAAHPTISQELPGLVREGRVVVKPNVERLAGDRVRFVDGTEERVDVAIYATGYRASFPFLDEALLPVRENRVGLYLHVVSPEAPGLYFLGLVQPLGPLPPLAEAQAEWVADLLAGQAALPTGDEMKAEIRSWQHTARERYVPTRRHALEVDLHRYLRAVRRERKRGARRARRRGMRRARRSP